MKNPCRSVIASLLWILLGLPGFLLMLSAEPTMPPKGKALPAVELKPGIYHVLTNSPSGEQEGAAVLRRRDANWILTYNTGSVGIGIRTGNQLAVGWRAGQGHGVTVYQIGPDGKLIGKWAAGNGELYDETLDFLKSLAD